ncbi:MAG: glycosyltransferase family 4 protein [Planctomycetes bacterium]|nr:glycosyltransferase family 4 protein [Planctomycetota bacterium]
MKVLVLTNAWPSERAPSLGVFIQSQVESLRRLGVVCDVEVIPGWRGKREYWRAVERVRARAAEPGFDLCHAHSGLPGWVALRQARLPVVVSFMGDDAFGTPDAAGRYGLKGRLVAWIGRGVARRAAAVIAKSEGIKRALGRADAQVIPNGVDFERFRPLDPAAARAGLGLDPAGRYVLFAGDPELPIKDFGLAQAAVQAAKARCPAAHLVAAARVPQERMPQYYNAADVLLLTSHHEGSPNTVKEAMACNLPVVSTDVGDVRAVIGGTPGCRVVPGRDAEALAGALLDVLERPLRTSGRAAIAHLEIGQVARRVLAVYEEVVGRRAVVPVPPGS